MKILWATTSFLHPTTRGGQIRTLEMLRRLHRRHEIHYVAIKNPREPEGLARAPEYSTRAYPFQHRVAGKRSPAFVLELAKSVFDPEPLSIRRFHSPVMGAFLARLIEKERFDREVCDFLTPASYFPNIERAVLFQHNVETMIWRRHVEHAGNPAVRWYMRKRFERGICRRAGHIAAVSGQDAATMRELFGVERVTAIPTAVRVPVVSTSVGAEGLEIHPLEDIRIADSPADFAAACLELLADPSLRRRQAAAWEMVAASFSWEQVARCFERVLEMAVLARV
jgi:glycosyltransferase involved in cell wall biosynthesis